MRKLLLATVAFALSVAASACGVQDDEGGSAAAQWTGKPWMQPPGTPLFAGLEVPQGAQLIGPVISRMDDRKEPSIRSQGGYLLIDGDIEDVAEDLVDQWPGPDTYGQYRRDECRLDREMGQRRCEFGLVIKPDDEENGIIGRGIEVTLWQDVNNPEAPGQGTIGLLTPPTTIPDALPVPPSGVDGPQSVASDVEYLPDLEIVPGSFLAGPAFPGSLTGGYVAVIGVDGDPDDVFDAYVAQDEDKPYFTGDEVFDGMRIRSYMSAEAGGIWLYITLNEIDGNAWILVSAQND